MPLCSPDSTGGRRLDDPPRPAPGPRPPQHASEPLPGFLEPDQLVASTRRPVPRAPLSRRARAALRILRVAVIIVSAIVIYAFVAQPADLTRLPHR